MRERLFAADEFRAALAGLPRAVARRWDYRVRRINGAQLAPSAIARWRVEQVARLAALGLRVGAGTDTPVRLAIPGFSLHEELELLVAAGHTTQQALAAATLAGPHFFGLEAVMGRIEAGQRADLVLLAADPLADIRNTRNIVGVLSGGQWRTASELRKLRR